MRLERPGRWSDHESGALETGTSAATARPPTRDAWRDPGAIGGAWSGAPATSTRPAASPALRLWLADELKAGIAPSSVHRHFRVLRRVLNVAVATELLQRSPCDGVKAPSVPATEMRFLPAPEVSRLAESITPAFRALVHTAAYSGLRWGELTGLRRAKLDLSTATV